MKPLRILITCQALHGRAGTELYVRDVALALLRMGHTPIVHASQLGDVAAEIRNLTIPVVDRLEAIAIVPDLILGQHHLPTMMALLQFAGVPPCMSATTGTGRTRSHPAFAHPALRRSRRDLPRSPHL